MISLYNTIVIHTRITDVFRSVSLLHFFFLPPSLPSSLSLFLFVLFFSFLFFFLSFSFPSVKLAVETECEYLIFPELATGLAAF